MAPRVHPSGGLINGSAGRVHITRYTGSITLELAQASWADYLVHLEGLGETITPLVFIADKPLPLPPVEVRKFWRRITEDSGFEAIAMVITGVVGLAAATVTHLGEQLVGVLDVNIRSFKDSESAAEWLANRYNCGIDEYDLQDSIDEVLKLDPDDLD